MKQEFSKSRVARSYVFPAATYSTPEESSFEGGVIATVENTMKKYTDNLVRFLEGISSRLSQLEFCCYNLDKSIGEMRLELLRDHGESESKLQSLEKHIQEVHRSVQILRDKQELTDTQTVLAKLQLAHKVSSSGGNEQRTSTPSSEAKKGGENPSDGNDQQQLAVTLSQVASPQQSSMSPLQSSPSSLLPPQSMAYYMPQVTTNNNTTVPPFQTPQYQHTPLVLQQDLSRMAPTPPSQPQANQQAVESLSPYQQQWGHQQQPAQQPQVRTSAEMGVYSSYLPPPHQSNRSPPEVQNALFMGASEAVSYVYGAAGRPIPPPSQHFKATGYGQQSGGEGYVPSGPCPVLPHGNNNKNVYVVYDGEGESSHHHVRPQFQQQSAYPSTQQRNNINMVVPRSSSSTRSRPYDELIDKLVGMGYRGDHIVAIIQRLDHNGQPIDFNSVLDMLNGGGSASHRGWRP